MAQPVCLRAWMVSRSRSRHRLSRGVVHDPEIRAVSEEVADAFGYAEMQIVSFEDLFGGKLHAALDRQHPRDLYDVKLLYENEGLTDDLIRTFLVYIACSARPVHELLNPNRIDLDQPYSREFEGLTKKSVGLDELLATREKLIVDIHSRLDKNTGRFLLSLHDGIPEFGVIDRPRAAELPAVRWKLLNLRRLIRENPKKHAEQRVELKRLLS